MQRKQEHVLVQLCPRRRPTQNQVRRTKQRNNKFNIELKEATKPEDPSRGEFRLPGAHNPAARPGTAELFLRDEAEVLRVYHALDGQTIRVGGELVGITVTNDAVVARGAPGGRRRRR